jgi:hypothetical protein
MLDNLCLGAALDLGAPSEVRTAHDHDSALARALASAERRADGPVRLAF